MYKYLLSLLLLVSISVHGNQNDKIIFTHAEEEWIKNHPVIHFGYEPNWPPYEIYENGEYKGIVAEYVSVIEKSTGIDMIPIPDITWEKALKGLEDGTINIVPSCAITPKRKEFLAFTKPYITDPLIICSTKESHYIGGMEDLYNKTVAVPKSYYTKEIIQADYPNIKIKEYDGVKKCLEALSFGKVDAFIGYLGVVSYYINNEGFTNLKIAAPTPFNKSGIGLAVTKNEEWIVFRDIVQKVMDNMTPHEKSDIRNDWISVRYENGDKYKKILIWTGIVLITLIGIAFFLTIWNRMLQKQIRFRDETEKKLNNLLQEVNKQNREKATLLQEIHHRVKNNLQIITSLLRLQANSTKNEEVSQSLNIATERIRAISLIHEKIYQSPTLNNISIDTYVSSLANEIAVNLGMKIKFEITVDDNIQEANLISIVPLGLILNELLTNSIKYGLKDKTAPMISIRFYKADSKIHMTYFDNGSWVENKNSDQFGTSLIEIFTEQLEGNYQLFKEENETRYEFEFAYQSIEKE